MKGYVDPRLVKYHVGIELYNKKNTNENKTINDREQAVTISPCDKRSRPFHETRKEYW